MAERQGTPPSTAPVPQSTPLKATTAAATYPFTTNVVERDKRMAQVGAEMQGKFVGPIEPEVFLDQYLMRAPKRKRYTPKQKAMFNIVSQQEAEVGMYQPLIDALKDHCPSLDFVNTSAHSDEIAWAHQPGLIKPDITTYQKGVERVGITDISKAEVILELKNAAGADGFDDDHGAQAEFESQTDLAIDTRNQLATYAAAQLTSQFRTHCFSVFLTRNHARLIRWDREGAVVTKRFDYRDEDWLVEFFWRYSHATTEERGHDPSVTEASEADAANARAKLEMPEGAKVYKFAVHNRVRKLDETGAETTEIQPCFYFGGKPAFRSTVSPVGRCTRGFVVVDEAGSRAYLKDTWRVESLGEEGEIYEDLRRAKVENIPTVIACGDVPGHQQRTKTSATVDAETHGQFTFRVHQHYRIAFREVGRPLVDFETTWEYINALKHALIAHQQAVVNAKILHRDVSVGNILITDKGGLLIDWEYSKPIGDESARILERTGTWQFISARLLSSAPGTVPHELLDDLESFFHVLCWLTLVYGKHGLSLAETKKQIYRAYDSWWGAPDGESVNGGDGKTSSFMEAFMDQRANLPEGPLRSLIVELEWALSSRYERPNRDATAERMRRERIGYFSKHDYTLGLWGDALKDPALLGDGRVDRSATLFPTEKKQRAMFLKRKLGATQIEKEEDEHASPKRRDRMMKASGEEFM